MNVLIKPGLLLGFLFGLSFTVSALDCEPGEEAISVVLLLPLDYQQNPFGQTLLDGFAAGSLEPLEQECEVNLRYFNTLDEESSFYTQWLQALELEPDLLIGPLLPEHQQQLVEMDRIELPRGTRWLYPGERTALPVGDQNQLYSFSISWYEQLRNLMEYGWEQGQNRVALLLPDSDLGRKVADIALLEWEQRGGEVVAQVHYGKRFSDLNRAMRQLLQQSRGIFDVVMMLVDDQRLRMVRPLMSYHSREEPVYSMMPPVGELGLGRDMEDVLYPMHPALLERPYPTFEVDDFLLQVENVGFDLMLLLRLGMWGQIEEGGSYFGRSGRYRMEQNQLLRSMCFVTTERGRRVVRFCPEPTEITGEIE